MSTSKPINDVLDATHLDHIINSMIENVSDSKSQIFEISEESRREHDALVKELHLVKKELKGIIERSDALEVGSRKSRNHLAEISSAFNQFGEADIRSAYETANTIQNQLTIVREMERQMKHRRNEIERRLIQLSATIEKADALIGRVTVVLNYLTSDLKQVGKVVASAREQRAFGLQMIEALEEERKRLAREIHDGPAQTLAQVLLGLDVVDRVGKKEGMAASQAELQKYRVMVQGALGEVRRIIYDLRPMSLDDLGLVPTLQKYMHRVSGDFPSIAIHFETLGKEKRLQSKIEAALFRLIQESVQNACAHAKPTQINIRIEYRSDKVLILVTDDGIGFDQSESKEGSYGLIGMRERAELLNGELIIHSKAGKGTKVLIHIPLQKEDELN
ncbi:sensor histidine kinase [Sporolactobacillus terrae]|uniref:sensor histidine kinase n=1 Tax=Sporolactobacillus terrae TaxID=269673 RepID=UPI00111AF78D|nr:sensor histidine kinase [Sporolactobacillus terrae]